MKTGILALFFLLIASMLALSLPDDSDAARFGGGRSFGSRPSYSQPARTPTRQPAQAAPGAAPTTPRTGMFGGMGGLFGGLLAGTLIGSLLSGGGFHGGGFLDLIILGALAVGAFLLYKRFRSQQAPSPAAASPGQPMQRTDFSSSWGALQNGPGSIPQADQTVDIPPGFDTAEFLRGAKAAYTRLQESWDRRDLEDIAQFASPSVVAEIRQQARAEPNPGKTELMLINANLIGVEEEGDETHAQVYFDVLMRERPDQPTPNNAREIWHFVKSSRDPSWKLDGIQQVE